MAKKKAPKPKAVNFTLIERCRRGEQETSVPHILMDRVIADCRPDLSEASIAIAWRKGWKEDNDSLLILGKMVKVSDLNKEFAEYDGIILLNEEAWGEMGERQREGLIHHELNHICPATNDGGEYKRDERDRIVYRYRKHDLEEFRSTVERYGFYRKDLESFVEAALAAKRRPLLKVAGE